MAGRSRRSFWRTLKDSLDQAGRLVDTDPEARRSREQEIVDRMADEVSAAGFGAAGILVAEGGKPLSFIAAQGLHFFTPHLGLVLGEHRVSNVACLLESRDNLERFASRLEKLDDRRGDDPRH